MSRIDNGQVCNTQGAPNPSTPALKVTGIPAGAKYLILKVTDEDYGNSGGHGIFRIDLPANTSETTIPSIFETKKELPAGVSLVKGEENGMSKHGHYLPPCSNGRNHAYYSDVEVYNSDDKKINANYIEWGRY